MTKKICFLFQISYLRVISPPIISDVETTTDLNILENENAKIKCVAKGNPIPSISWNINGRFRGTKTASSFLTKVFFGPLFHYLLLDESVLLELLTRARVFYILEPMCLYLWLGICSPIYCDSFILIAFCPLRMPQPPV